MEDRHVTLSEIAPGVFYSAVFDGHGGPKTAEFAQQHLQTMIRNRDSLAHRPPTPPIHPIWPTLKFRNFRKISKNLENIRKISVGESKKRDSNFFKKRDFARACVEGFILTDRLISQKIDESSGSTATAVLIDHDQVYCVSGTLVTTLKTNSHYVIRTSCIT